MSLGSFVKNITSHIDMSADTQGYTRCYLAQVDKFQAYI